MKGESFVVDTGKVLMLRGRPFTSKIYSSAAAKKRSEEIKSSSNETAKKVGNKANAAISSAVPAGTSGSTSARAPLTSNTSYARAAAQPASSSGLESTNPKPVPGLQELGLGAPVASPQPRVTRTRSRAGRVVDDD
jgi:hypothetical protein